LPYFYEIWAKIASKKPNNCYGTKCTFVIIA